MRREGIGSAGEMGQMVSPKEGDRQYPQEENVASLKSSSVLVSKQGLLRARLNRQPFSSAGQC